MMCKYGRIDVKGYSLSKAERRMFCNNLENIRLSASYWGALTKSHLHECAMRHREMMDDTTAKSYLHVLNGGEYQTAQFLVKLIQLNNLVKRSTYGILMGCRINLKRLQITCKTKIVNAAKGIIEPFG